MDIVKKGNTSFCGPVIATRHRIETKDVGAYLVSNNISHHSDVIARPDGTIEFFSYMPSLMV